MSAQYILPGIQNYSLEMTKMQPLERGIVTTIICCSEASDPQWRWLEPAFGGTVQFDFVRCVPDTFLERNFQLLNLSRIRGCFRAVRLAKRTNDKIIVAFGPTLAAWCSIFSFLLRQRTVILAHTFNFTELPHFWKRLVFTWALNEINRFVVFSNFERKLYAEVFRLPKSRFEFIHWGVRPPVVVGMPPPNENNYICAIGGNARDYITLISAAREMLDITFVIIARPSNLVGINLPPNVRVHFNLPLDETMNMLRYSRFMVLPLLNSTVPCGHVTLVAAMHLGKAMVITDSEGVSDYAADGYNCILVPPAAPKSLALAMRSLWSNASICKRLGDHGLEFASNECNEDKTVSHFRNWLFGPTGHQAHR